MGGTLKGSTWKSRAKYGFLWRLLGIFFLCILGGIFVFREWWFVNRGSGIVNWGIFFLICAPLEIPAEGRAAVP